MGRSRISKIRHIMSLRCDEASQLISACQERSLDTSERWALSFHLLICRACRRYRRQLALLRRLLHAMSHPSFYETAALSFLSAEHSHALKKRISTKLEKGGDSM